MGGPGRDRGNPACAPEMSFLFPQNISMAFFLPSSFPIFSPSVKIRLLEGICVPLGGTKQCLTHYLSFCIRLLLKPLNSLVQAFEEGNYNFIVLLTRFNQKPQCSLQENTPWHLKIINSLSSNQKLSLSSAEKLNRF